MKRPFSESRHFVSGLCEGMKTAAIYKNSILDAIKAQLGVNPRERNAVQSAGSPETVTAVDPGGEESNLMKNRKKDQGSQQARAQKII